MNTILKAVQFAEYKHRGQERKDIKRSPYISHPISVASVISEVGGIDDLEVLAAALLHDTVEDTGTSLDELEKEFGERVRKLVEEVTDDKNLPKDERKKRQIEHAARLSDEAVLIKLGDKISNVKDVIYSPPSDWNTERRKKYLDWAEAVINNCSNVNPSMKKHFANMLAAGRQALLIEKDFPEVIHKDIIQNKLQRAELELRKIKREFEEGTKEHGWVVLHSRGFEDEEVFGMVLREYKDLKSHELKEILALIAPELVKDLFKIRPCVRDLKYVGSKKHAHGNSKQNDFFNLNKIYKSIDYNGGTYTIEGYEDGRKKRIEAAYFEVVRDYNMH